jgi:hypothetical protein
MRFLAILAGVLLIGTTATHAQTATPPPDAGHALWRWVNGPAVSVPAGTVVCTTIRGVEDSAPDMNKEQLDSLGCRRYSVQFEASAELNFHGR